MKKFTIMMMATLCLAALTTERARAVEAGIGIDANSAYVWRGITFNDGFVLQPYLDVSKAGFNVNVWANFDVDDYDGTLEKNEFSEVDLTASYNRDFGPVNLGIGIIEYLFPNGGESTTELFATAAMDLKWNLSVGLDLYYDVDQVESLYGLLGLYYARDLGKGWDMSLGASAGYAGADFAEIYAGGTDSGLFNYLLSAGVAYAVTEALSLGANIYYTDSLDDDVLPDDTVDTKFYGGVSLAYTF